MLFLIRYAQTKKEYFLQQLGNMKEINVFY